MRYGRNIAGGNCARADALGTPNAHRRAGLCGFAKSRAMPHTHLPIASLLVLVLIAGTVRAETAPNIVLRWNNALLEAVRNAHLGPPMVARALATIGGPRCAFRTASSSALFQRRTIFGAVSARTVPAIRTSTRRLAIGR